MIYRLIRLMTLATILVPASAQAGDIYRWTDEQGRVTYGDSVPDRYKRVARRVEIGAGSVDLQGEAGAAPQKPQAKAPAAPSSATGSGHPAEGKSGAAGK